MATYSRVKTFVANETLTASDLNAEFNNIITNTNSGNLNSDNVSTSSAWTWTGYHTYSTSSRIALSDDIYMTLGNATDGDYRVRYNATSTALEIMSTDSDGAGTDAVVLDIQDGTDDLRLRGGFSTDNNTAPTSGIVTGGNIVSDTDSTDDLGTTSVRWANLYVDAATITNNLTVGGTLTLTGGLTLNGNVTVGDNATDTLTINSTITSNLLFTDATYDIGASGATRPRDLFLSRNAVMGGTLGVTGLITASGGVSGALTGNVTGNVTGDVTGDVTGNLTGNVTGNVTGNLTGDVTGNISGNVTGGTISGTTGTFSGAVNANNLVLAASNSYPILLENQDGTTADAAISTYDDANGTLLALGSNFYYNSGSEARFNTSEEAAGIVLNRTGTISFRTSDGSNNTVERVSIGNTGDLAVDTDTLFVDASADRVGINSASPGEPLTVVGGGSTTSTANFTGGAAANDNATLASDYSMYYQIDANNTVGGRVYNWRVGGKGYSDGTSLLTLNASGNMGLGTSSPASLSNYSLITTSDTSGGGLVCQYNGTSKLAVYSANNDGYYDAAVQHVFRTGGVFGGSIAMTIDSSQRVGIGTSSPSALLHLYKSGSTQAGLIETDQSASVLNFKSTGQTAGQPQIGCSGSNLILNTNGAERARIDSSGNCGIGTSSPERVLDIVQSGDASMRLKAGTTSNNSYVFYENSTGGIFHIGKYGTARTDVKYGQTLGGCSLINDADTASNGLVIGTQSSSAPVIFGVGNQERARIHSDGIFTLSSNTNSYGTTGWYGVAADTGNGSINISRNGSNVAAFFHTSNANGINGSAVGTISITTTSTAYNTSSDYRLKENVVGITDGITRIKSLKPSRFNFISNADQTVDGFVAHEVSDVVPEAITGAKDAVDDEGNPEYQGIDQSKLVPLLTAALQEAITKIETLETKVAALEAA